MMAEILQPLMNWTHIIITIVYDFLRLRIFLYGSLCEDTYTQIHDATNATSTFVLDYWQVFSGYVIHLYANPTRNDGLTRTQNILPDILSHLMASSSFHTSVSPINIWADEEALGQIKSL